MVVDEDDAEVAIFFLPDAPCTILSIPIIKRLMANINVRINIPTKGFVNTINDMPINNAPTPTRNTRDHLRSAYQKFHGLFLQTPINETPMTSKVTNNPL